MGERHTHLQSLLTAAPGWAGRPELVGQTVRLAPAKRPALPTRGGPVQMGCGAGVAARRRPARGRVCAGGPGWDGGDPSAGFCAAS